MALKVVWTKTALRDLELAAGFIARDSAHYASTLVREAIVASRSLETLARRGRIVPEINREDTRELFVCNYRLIYRIGPGAVRIVGFVHGSRDAWAIIGRTRQ
ncbi:MAG: type II toxin-antitoxin system RelE/ParE family toxin [Elusimicrobiota bacterium]